MGEKGLTEKAVWHVVREYARKAGMEKLATHDLPDLCAALSRGRRRTGADPIPPWARLDPNDRTVPRLQAAYSIRRERPDRHRAQDLIGCPQPFRRGDHPYPTGPLRLGVCIVYMAG